MKQPPSKKPAGKPPAKAPARTPAKQQPVVSEDDVPSHPPEVEEAPVVDPAPSDPAPAPTPPPAPPKPGISLGEDPVKTLSFIESIIGTLTFRTVALVALLTAIGLVLFALYENRDDIVAKFTSHDSAQTASVAAVPTNWVLSEGSKQSLINLAKATNVQMVILSDVDLKKNRRVARYYFIDNPNIKLPPLAVQALALPLPVFDYDAKNTEQMIAVLSNDFRCDKYEDTIYNRFAPELATEFPTICRLAVPPFVGTFVGFITVGIAANVSATELETIRLEVSRIAVEIYMNDVAKKITPPATK